MKKQQTVPRHRAGRAWLRACLGVCALAGGAALAMETVNSPPDVAAPYIAGVAPDHRRADVPVITAAPPLDEKRAFHGISQPYPASLGVFKDQGAWYTPFIRPGMASPYDLRGFH
jgi:hypothetical protein